MKNKPNAKQFVQNPSSGCGLGCFSIGCIGVIGMVLIVCTAGYYAAFHSNLPLRLIEAAIEEDGEVEIEGLKGSLSTGFSADEIRFKSVDDQWSNLTNLKFKYDGDVSIFGTDRLIISELSVDGGTIYADWDPDENEIDFDPNFTDEIEEEFEGIEKEIREEMGQSPNIREFKVDLVRVANIKIINPATQLEISIDEMTFDGFHWLDGELKSLGELLVRSSQLDLKTVPSVEFAEMKNSERFVGTLRAQTDHRLKVDVPFVFDFAVDDDFNVSIKAMIFDGKLEFDRAANETTLRYVNFSPSEFIELEPERVLLSKINMRLTHRETDGTSQIQVGEDGSFELGQTRFNDLRADRSKGRNVVVAQGNVNGEPVTASLRIGNEYLPIWSLNLESESPGSKEDLWAQTFFGEPYDQLSEKNALAIRNSIAGQDVAINKSKQQSVKAEESDEDQNDNDEKTATESDDKAID